MIPWILLLCPLSILATLDRPKTLGVAPDALSTYTPTSSGTWTCLDGSKDISWNAVNDDYCDCPDGSDEPGTSACANGSFYCRNEGHIGARIPSSRVNDGLCEKECCDGSDEATTGICPDICDAVGKAYRKQRDAENRIRKTGSKIRSTYIAFAQKEKKRLELLVISSAEEVKLREAEVARLQDVTDRTESMSAAALAHKQESPLYKSLLTHSAALSSLRSQYTKLQAREKQLGEVLEALRAGYNPNYQDMAVLEAVRGWEALAGISSESNAEDSDAEAEETKEAEGGEAVKEDKEAQEEEEEWTEDKLDALVKTDYVSLLLEHDEHVQSPSGESDSILFDPISYLPDSWIPTFEEYKDQLVSLLHSVGLLRGSDHAAADSSAARAALTKAQNTLESTRRAHTDAEADLEELFALEGFGAQGEWKKLDGTCLEHDSGDYTYEVCLFDEARQKPKSGGTTFSLGKFASWNPDAGLVPGEPAYYSKQVYNKGARCWNGPERNVILVMTCGTENAIHSVVELEKCEYQFTGTSPALCLPLDEEVKREEL